MSKAPIWTYYLNNNYNRVTSEVFDLLGAVNTPECKVQFTLHRHTPTHLGVEFYKYHGEPVDVILIAIVNNITKTQRISQWNEYSLVTFLFIDYRANALKNLQVDDIVTCLAVLEHHSESLNIQNVPENKYNFEYFYLNSELSDVTIQIDGNILPAHKTIIAAKSSVFQRMFLTDMRESTENRVIMADIEVDVMRDFLHFLYTGKTKAQNDVDFAAKVLGVAEKYDVADLSKICSDTLFKNLTVENVVSIVIIADTYSINYLRNESLKFMVNYAENLNSDDLKKFHHTNPDLAYEFSTLVIADKKSKQ